MFVIINFGFWQCISMYSVYEILSNFSKNGINFLFLGVISFYFKHNEMMDNCMMLYTLKIAIYNILNHFEDILEMAAYTIK